MRKSYFALLTVLLSSLPTFANSITQSNVSEAPYYCSKTTLIELFDTAYGNVKEVVIFQQGTPEKLGYVVFSVMKKDSFEGSLYTSMTFPELGTGVLPSQGPFIGNLQVQSNITGTFLTLQSHRSDATFSDLRCTN